MVEFGLKLSDNKVEDWAHAYINYEALKKFIAAAQKAEKIREELEAQNVTLAAEIKAQVAKNDEIDASSHHSSVGLNDNSQLSLSNNDGDESNNGSETQALISVYGESPSKYNSYGSSSMNRMKRSGSESSISSLFALGEMKTTVGGYFQRHSYEHKMKKALRNENAAIKNFSSNIYDEAVKVNELYYRILDEMQERFEYLEDTVRNSEYFNTKYNEKSWGKRMSMRLRLTSPATTKLIDISDEIEEAEDETNKIKTFEAIRESDSVQRAMTDLHRRSKLLSNFAIMNSTGFIKIVKKYDKAFPSRKGEFKEITSNGFICNDGKDVSSLSDKMERQFAKWFCDGNITEARSLLLPKKGDGLDMDWSQLRLGYRLGMCSVLALWVAWDCVWGMLKDGHTTIGGRTAFPVFRACGGLLLVHWFWGVSVYVWNRYRINYIFLFDFDPRIVQTPVMIFEDATDETLVFLLLMLLYYKSGAHDIPDIIPPGGYPFLLVLFTVKRLIFPLKVRVPLWQAIGKAVLAPIFKPTFFQTYVADIFTSMVKVFQDIVWTSCFFISGDFLIFERDGAINKEPKNWHQTFWYRNICIPIICLLPLLIRFNQCLRRYVDTGKRNPNLFNAAKYALSQTVTLFGAFHPLYMIHVAQKADMSQDDTIIVIAETGRSLFDYFWLGLFVSSSLYSYFWDVRMDWGLGRLDNRLLGTRLMFPNQNWYYVVMVVDLFLRFMWVTTLIPPQSGASFEIPQYLTMVTMFTELFRRTIWGFFRLEHEHRHNSQGFRRVDFVPLHFSTESPNKATKIEHDGWQVLGEVVAVTIVVLSISAWSVSSAQKATNNMGASHGHIQDL